MEVVAQSKHRKLWVPGKPTTSQWTPEAVQLQCEIQVDLWQVGRDWTYGRIEITDIAVVRDLECYDGLVFCGEQGHSILVEVTFRRA